MRRVRVMDDEGLLRNLNVDTELLDMCGIAGDG